MSIQSQIDAAASAGGGDVILPASVIVQNSQADQIIARNGVRVIGSGKVGFNYHANGPAGGTIFDIRWGDGVGSSGDPARAAIIQQAGSSVLNVGAMYPQDVHAAAPREWGSFIQAYDPARNAYDITTKQVYGFMSYVTVDYRVASRGSVGISNAVIEDITGCPIKSNLALDGMTDWCSIRNLSCNSGFMRPGYFGGLVEWAGINGIAYDIGGCDAYFGDRHQAYGYGRGAVTRGGVGYGGRGPYILNNPSFDACFYGVEVVGPVFGVGVFGGAFAPFEFTTGRQGTAIVAIGQDIQNVMFKNNTIGGPARWATYIDGPRNQQVIGNQAEAIAHTDGPAWVAVNGDRVNVSNNQETGFAGNVAASSNTGKPVINSGNQ